MKFQSFHPFQHARLGTLLLLICVCYPLAGDTPDLEGLPPPPPPPDTLPPPGNLPPDLLPPEILPSPFIRSLDDPSFIFHRVRILECVLSENSIDFVVDSEGGLMGTSTDFVVAATNGISQWATVPGNVAVVQGETTDSLKISMRLSVGSQRAWFFEVLRAEPSANP